MDEYCKKKYKYIWSYLLKNRVEFRKNLIVKEPRGSSVNKTCNCACLTASFLYHCTVITEKQKEHSFHCYYKAKSLHNIQYSRSMCLYLRYSPVHNYKRTVTHNTETQWLFDTFSFSTLQVRSHFSSVIL